MRRIWNRWGRNAYETPRVQRNRHLETNTCCRWEERTTDLSQGKAALVPNMIVGCEGKWQSRHRGRV